MAYDLAAAIRAASPGGSPDPYTAQLQQMLQGISSGFTGPTEASFQVQRVTPAEEQAAYQTGYSGLLEQLPQYFAPTQAAGFGEVPESRISGYFDLANPYLFGQGMEGINATLAEAGFAPSGTGGVGPQAEMAARLKAQLGVQQAQALIQNAMTGQAARTRGAFGQAEALQGTARDIGANRYRALTTPNVTRVSGTRAGAGGTGASVQQRNPWETAFARAGEGGGGGTGAAQGSIGGTKGAPSYGGGGGYTGLDWYANMKPNQSTESANWNADQPTGSWSAWEAYPTSSSGYSNLGGAMTPEEWWKTERGQAFRAKGWTPSDWSFLNETQ